VQAKEWGNVEPKIIITHNLGDGVRPISKWFEILMGLRKALFVQMQPKFFTHLKLVLHPMLIMSLLVLGIGLLHLVNLLVDVKDVFNRPDLFISLKLYMCGFCQSSEMRHGNINQT